MLLTETNITHPRVMLQSPDAVVDSLADVCPQSQTSSSDLVAACNPVVVHYLKLCATREDSFQALLLRHIERSVSPPAMRSQKD